MKIEVNVYKNKCQLSIYIIRD